MRQKALRTRADQRLFIHTNPLHSLEHLHFEQAVAEAERITGGRGYFPNEEFRRLYRSGRITAHDLHEALVSCKPDGRRGGCDRCRRRAEGIRSNDVVLGCICSTVSRRWIQLTCPGKSIALRPRNGSREDLPEVTRTILLEKAKTDLHVSLNRIGREWTLSDWSRLS